MKGAVVINPFLIPVSCVHQDERLKEEFNKLGVNLDIITDGYLRTLLFNGKVESELKDYQFIIYLDKDKYLSQSLNSLGIKLFNSHEAIRTCDDKGETYIALADKGINLPNTLFGALCFRKECIYTESEKQEIIAKMGFPMIIKESYGSMGMGVHLVKDKVEFDQTIEKVRVRPHLFQEYLDYKVGVDVRVIVIGGKAVASMERQNENDFRSNIAVGGKGKKIELPIEFRKTAEKTAKVLGLDYCGVDILYGRNGEPYVCEVNSNAFMDEIEKITGVNVAYLYAKHILETLRK